MSMLDSFFNKGFKGAKCKTLLKLTIPRIKLLRNRRGIQIKQMRKDIAKLLENGQEATARIRVEHIIREENMMAAQEIVELFCELITVRLPIIETQRECPLDLKEAISSVCFAAPRCADLPELQQVQMLFASKYGKEFVAAATELMPECGVNRQLIELLSIRAPSAETKLKLLREIAEEHEIDWDPSASETEFFKPHEDLLNGPTQFISGSKLPLPEEKHDDSLHSAPAQACDEHSDPDTGFDLLDLPGVPKVSLRPSEDTVLTPEVVPPPFPSVPDFEIDLRPSADAGLTPEVVPVPFPSAPDLDIDHGIKRYSGSNENHMKGSHSEPDEVAREPLAASPCEAANLASGARGDKQFLPFIAPPSLAAASFPASGDKPVPLSRTKTEANVDLQDVLAAAHAAADSAERAASAARSAASLAHVRITELMKKSNDQEHREEVIQTGDADDSDRSASMNVPQFEHQQSFGDANGYSSYLQDPLPDHRPEWGSEMENPTSFDIPKDSSEQPLSSGQVLEHGRTHQPQRLPSMEDDPYFSYPNLFTSQESNHESGSNSQSRHEH
ncbi:IST1-like protein [Telopea speciosissima]|uniref:IST1-like protein n=1 Tax=Telopea speciosissima TaxID=54955 RepID=UPI001CC6B032|nr:IST1-like protein [Telopea speciosissima]